MLVLGLESSCDETGAAVVEDGRTIRSNVVATQHDLHRPFGGVVPEVAARAHAERITALADEALAQAGCSPRDLDAVAVVNRPGLVGALLVGVAAAKGLALAWNKPLLGIDHIEAHVYAAHLAGFEVYPHVSLIVSGGHTCLYRVDAPGSLELAGQTRDDAAGEAFDKVAKLLGLPFPGGPALARCASAGNAHAIEFPRCGPNEKPGDTLDFSFSGLKTAVYYKLHGGARGKGKEPVALSEAQRADMAASFQEAACEILVEKTLSACARLKLDAAAVGGGVACNKRLREIFQTRAEAAQPKLRVFFPPPALCTDNAAMTAGLAYHRLARGEADGWELDVDPTPKRRKVRGK
ncbi:MAG: tRNA (adenosine(37)-N6)-threonylcarbamoyltransferase complex transferase subunit TsaD [Planctomycetes bacterium]|nr:tRNA (adenosine(37)-N6)-threonylcarbamoyltransferase complex transferase subunit TsaD [Planctomycetota bacterium]